MQKRFPQENSLTFYIIYGDFPRFDLVIFLRSKKKKQQSFAYL